MMKKVLFSLLLVLLIVPVVYAAAPTGSESNPLQLEYGETYTLNVTDMFAVSEAEAYAGRDSYRFYTTLTATGNDFWFDVGFDVPKALSAEENTYVEMELMQDGLGVITGSKAWLMSNYEWYNSFEQAVKPGTYKVRITVSFEKGFYNNYQFNFDYYEWNETHRGEIEPNNTPAVTTDIPLNEMIFGYLEYHDNADFFSTWLTAGVKTRVYLDEFEDLKDDGYIIGRCTHVGSAESCVEDIMARAVLDPARSQYYFEFVPTYTGKHSFYVTGNYDYGYLYYRIGVYQAGTINTNVYQYIDSETKYNNDYSKVVFRMYNPVTGEHLYTTDDYEAKIIYSQQGWGFEGVGWYTTTSGTPVYRLYNPVLGNHLYTSDTHEISIITSTQGWVMDFNGAPVMYSTGDDKDVAVYRLYNQPLNGLHHLTTDEHEYNVLPSQGWAQEGVSMYVDWYGYPEPTEYYHVNF